LLLKPYPEVRTVKIDVKLIEECIRHFNRAYELLEKIEGRIAEFCAENNIEVSWDETFPFVAAELWTEIDGVKYLMVYSVRSGKPRYLVVDGDGEVRIIER
jgi:hypothetical protein